MKVQPLARQESLIVKEVDGETLVYDLETNNAHCLNSTAARIWQNCDGQSTVDEIAERLKVDLKAPVDESVVWLALDQLEKFKLLAEPVAKPAGMGVSRRQVMRAVSVAAILLPMVTSLVVPAAAQQGSPVVPPGGCCVSPNDCISQKCCQDPGCLVVPGSPANSTKKCFPVGPGQCPN
jgi:hypothetical protein